MPVTCGVARVQAVPQPQRAALEVLAPPRDSADELAHFHAGASLATGGRPPLAYLEICSVKIARS